MRNTVFICIIAVLVIIQVAPRMYKTLEEWKEAKEEKKREYRSKQLHDDLENNYLIYNPLTFDKSSEDWLRDIILCSEEYRADAISMIMAEMHIVSSVLMRTTTKEYKKRAVPFVVQLLF